MHVLWEMSHRSCDGALIFVKTFYQEDGAFFSWPIKVSESEVVYRQFYSVLPSDYEPEN